MSAQQVQSPLLHLFSSECVVLVQFSHGVHNKSEKVAIQGNSFVMRQLLWKENTFTPFWLSALYYQPLAINNKCKCYEVVTCSPAHLDAQLELENQFARKRAVERQPGRKRVVRRRCKKNKDQCHLDDHKIRFNVTTLDLVKLYDKKI